MNVAYVDTSCLVAIAFDEPGGREMTKRFQGVDRLVASNLVEAEFKESLSRERIDGDGSGLLSWLTWVYPNRPLTPEFDRVLAHGYVRGADLWHLACAIYLAGKPEQIAFLTLDKRQRHIASAVGFKVP